jgi:Na+/H+ antiporter NhaD/arsenite permease-like protein
MVDSPMGLTALAIFVCVYTLVALEEYIGLRKSKPVILGAGLIWILVALAARSNGHHVEEVREAVNHNLGEYASLFLFLLVAMTYVNSLKQRNLFAALRSWLIRKRFSYRGIFWLTGILAFLISPLADNLTTALLMGAVVMATGQGQPRFIALACVNVVIAANAGGAFSPFGDLTTLLVWEAGYVPTGAFLNLVIPSLVNFLVPACIMQFALPAGVPEVEEEAAVLKRGALFICLLFILTIATALTFEQVLGLPPFLGMMTGFSYLLFYFFYLKRQSDGTEPAQFNIFKEVANAEWDTLLFFFGVIFCVGGLAYFGYLELLSATTYGELGPTWANVIIGVVSAVVDNIPVMFAIITMNPEMDTAQWLLVCLTAGVGGSLLSIGSAAGVALMGQSRGHYSFFSHLKWSWAIALGYAASIAVHILLNGV